MTAKQLLIQARGLIADKSHWCQNTNARNENREKTSILNDDACQWCANGAIIKVGVGSYEACKSAVGILDEVTRRHYRIGGIISVNDMLGHDEVMRCFDEAIACFPT